MSDEEVAAYRAELDVRCTGFDVPAPLRLFEHAGLPRELLQSLKKRGFEAPTPIQCQALPVALSGRDLIGVAATGSGKTAAYLLPIVVHCLGQPALARGDGPIALCVVPTHELCEQIVQEARKLCKAHGERRGLQPLWRGLQHATRPGPSLGSRRHTLPPPSGLRCAGVFGGVGKYEQYKELKAGAEIVVGTPGRLLELIKVREASLALLGLP